MPCEAAIQTTAHRNARNERIRSQFNGANVPALAARWGLSKRHVCRIVSGRDKAQE